jgi:TonB-dependent Receptor Plug Domain
MFCWLSPRGQKEGGMRKCNVWIERIEFLSCITSRALAQIALLGFLALPAWPQQTSTDLTTKSLEDLMNVQVTSVSKSEQTLSRTASAIFVITAEDISRSGATNIPDLLRMVPGMDVAQINANTWAISARGLNGWCWWTAARYTCPPSAASSGTCWICRLRISKESK